MVFATTLVLLGVSCATRDPDAALTSAVEADDWLSAHAAAVGRLDDAIGQILSAIEGNDIRLMGAGPRHCATEAGSLAMVANDAGAVVDSERLVEVAALCAWLRVPAEAHDVDSVVRTLDPLLTAVGSIAPLLNGPDSLS
jgi:hypothetical protein